MKKILHLIVFIFLTLNFFASPFNLLNVTKKIPILINKSNFIKTKVKTDSVKNIVSTSGMNSLTTYSHYIYYDKNKLIILQDNPDRLLQSETILRNTRRALKYIQQHHDSILIWYHPTINGQIALSNESEINTKGYLMQIILNIILLIVAILTLRWLILKIKNKKNEES